VPLSVVIITLDERENLPRCLASVTGLAAEIVVVDSHSRDGTQQLAREAGATVVERDFTGHVDQKSHALGLAREDWVLCLDADEWLDETLRAEVARVIASPAGAGADGYELNRRTQYLGAWIDHCGWSPEWRLRLVRRGHAAWTGADPHDRLQLRGAVGRLQGRLCHRPYRTLGAHLAKMDRYTDTMAAARHAAGERGTLAGLALRPAGRFVRMYLVQGGVLDGWRGFVVCSMGAFYVFLKYAKLRALGAERGRSAAS
jgi:glycosyltransferase involved in cell wall biosynthesis